MKWILCGKNTAASRALELLAERGDEVWALATRGDDGRDGWQRSFRATAERLGVRCDRPRIHEPVWIERLAGFGADALISIQYDQILRGALLRGVGCPCLNLHFSLLPRHRGVQPVAWAILSGDREAGVTLHHMKAAIDAGDVIAQRRVPVAAGGTARELYDALSAACVELFRESYPFGSELLSRRLEQDASRASYHRAGELDFTRRRVDWTRPAPELHAWLRAMIFPPLQYPETGWREQTLRIERVGAALGEPAGSAAPGYVVDRDARGLAVATGAGTVRIEGLARAGDPAGPAESVLDRVAVGDRLGPERKP